MRLAWIVVCATVFLMPGCSPAPQQQTDITADSLVAVQEASKARLDALQSGDLEAFLELHADDVVMLPPHAEELLGKVAMRQRVAGRFETVTYEGTMQSEELRSLGPGVALDWGTYAARITEKETGSEQSDVGSYLTIWQKGDDGKWRVAYDVWHSNRPMPDAEK